MTADGDESPGSEGIQDLGADAGAAIRRHVEQIFAEAEAGARKIEQRARQDAERAARSAQAEARAEVQSARREVLDEAQTRAAAIVQGAEEDAVKIRRRAHEEAAQSRERGLKDAERAAARAQARLSKFADTTERELAALLAGLRREAGGGRSEGPQMQYMIHPPRRRPRLGSSVLVQTAGGPPSTARNGMLTSPELPLDPTRRRSARGRCGRA